MAIMGAWVACVHFYYVKVFFSLLSGYEEKIKVLVKNIQNN